MLKKTLAVLLSSFLISTAVHQFLVPFQILDGGMIGIGLILNYVLGWNIGAVILACSFPVYVLAWFYNRSFFYTNVIGLLISAVFLTFFQPVSFTLQTSPLFSAILGGILIGTGIGVMLLNDITSEGLDLFAQLLSRIFKMNAGMLIYLFDLLILTTGMLVLHQKEVVLSLITVTAAGLFSTLITFRKYAAPPVS
ncbi:YitT family protein [Paenibacillus silviterrae]|uniref:YitT family protein n=1 Tax=Paenibacillus silviterrae TaxID=3242194 RepID=UPI002542D63B|nr:YitT family protein [Paenibacillus chinjuensis]